MSEPNYTNYYFLPFLRRGLNAYITTAATGKRSQLNVQLNVENDAAISDPIEPKTIELFGPGDIKGFDPRIIVRTEPKKYTGDFEPNYFPFVEFADPDFPWRFTPDCAGSNGRLKPWLALIVLTAEDVPAGGNGTIITKEISPDNEQFDTSSNMNFVSVNPAHLPDLDQSWRWAHVQITGDSSLQTRLDGSSPGADQKNILDEELQSVLQNEPERAVSRLLCPRRLMAGMKYYAYIVPTFKAGMTPGEELPAGGKANEPAWTTSSKDPITLPYYYKWEFRTGLRGDFENLVRMLEPRPLPGLGKKDIDCGNPGFGLNLERIVTWTEGEAEKEESVHSLEFESAVKSIDTEYTKWGDDNVDPDADADADSNSFQTRFADLLNRTFVELELPDDPNEKPRVIAPVYGWFHRNRKDPLNSEIGKSEWLDQLNLDPRHRYNAGIGTEVIKKNQEQLMASAWDQLGDILEVNKILMNAQTGREISSKIEKRMQLLSTGDYLRATGALHGRIINENEESKVTVKKMFADSMVGPIPFSPSLRKIFRKRGVVRKRQKPDFSERKDIIDRLNNESLKIADTRIKSPGIIMMGDITEKAVKDILPVIIDEPVKIEMSGDLDYTFSIKKPFFNIHYELEEHIPDWLSLKKNKDGTYTLKGKPPAQTLAEKQVKSPTKSFSVEFALKGSDKKNTKNKICYFKQSFYIFVCTRKQLSSTVSTLRTFENRYHTRREENLEEVTLWKIGEVKNIVTSPSTIAKKHRFIESSITYKAVEEMVFKMPMNDTENRAIGMTIADALKGPLAPLKPAPDKKSAIANLDDLRTNIKADLSPEKTIKMKVAKKISAYDAMGRKKEHDLKPILAAPEFPAPMYEELADMSKELLLRGIDTIPQNTVALLETNQRFIESYMCGLNAEFSRELLWRGYPVGMKGSYFRQFWDVSNTIPDEAQITEYYNCYKERMGLKPVSEWSEEDKTGLINIYEDHMVPGFSGLSRDEKVETILKREALEEALKDIPPLHEWNEKIGYNYNVCKNEEESEGETDDEKNKEKLILVIRGDLLKRYPNTIIYAVKGTVENEPPNNIPDLPEFTGETESGKIIYPIFGAQIDPDITFLGFDLTADEIRNNIWYFVFQERVSESRMGVDVPSTTALGNCWDNLGWHHFGMAESYGVYINDKKPDPTSATGLAVNDWDISSASIASIALQKPVRIIISAKQIIPD